jgi:hypothetical protein
MHYINWNQYLLDNIHDCNIKQLKFHLEQGVTEIIPIIVKIHQPLNHATKIMRHYPDAIRILLRDDACNNFHSRSEYLEMIKLITNELITLDSDYLISFISQMIVHVNHHNIFNDLFLEILENHKWSFNNGLNHHTILASKNVQYQISVLTNQLSHDQAFKNILNDIHIGLFTPRQT